MAETNFASGGPVPGMTCFKEAVCVNAGRIFDSCSSKDCLEDLKVYFTTTVQPVINTAQTVKCRRAEVLNVYMDVENVPFNKGFYSVDMTFYFLITLDAFTSPACPPTPCQGLAVFSKKVILYGSEGNVKNFSSADCRSCKDCGKTDMPAAKVQVVDPIVLSCRFCDTPNPQEDCPVSIPASLSERFGGSFENTSPSRHVYVTIGIFSIVQLEREVQMMIPVYDYSVPDKECISTADDPCELFKRIKFPVNEFFPPKLSELDCGEETET